jgi:hypothetical protein
MTYLQRTVILPTNFYTDQNIKRSATAKFLGCVTCDTIEHHTYDEPVVYLIICCACSETDLAYMVKVEKDEAADPPHNFISRLEFWCLLM